MINPLEVKTLPSFRLDPESEQTITAVFVTKVKGFRPTPYGTLIALCFLSAAVGCAAVVKQVSDSATNPRLASKGCTK